MNHKQMKEYAEKFIWLLDHAEVGWDLLYNEVIVRFHLDSVGFNNLDDAVDQARKKQNDKS